MSKTCGECAHFFDVPEDKVPKALHLRGSEIDSGQCVALPVQARFDGANQPTFGEYPWTHRVKIACGVFKAVK